MGAERGSRVSQGFLNPHYVRVYAAEHASHGPSRLLERRHAFAEIVERGAGVLVERQRVNFAHPEREFVTNSENASRHGHLCAIVPASSNRCRQKGPSRHARRCPQERGDARGDGKRHAPGLRWRAPADSESGGGFARVASRARRPRSNVSATSRVRYRLLLRNTKQYHHKREGGGGGSSGSTSASCARAAALTVLRSTPSSTSMRGEFRGDLSSSSATTVRRR